MLIHILDDVARHHILRQDDAFIIIQHTGEYFVGMIVQQADECHPFLLVVLEADNVCIQYSGTCFNDRRRFARGKFGLLVTLGRDEHAGTRTVAVNRTALAAGFPCFYIQTVHEVFVYVVRQVDGYADRVVHPFLDTSLHLDFHQPVHVVGGCFIIR